MDNHSFFEKVVMAGLGVYSLTKEKAQELMDDLVQKGELSKDEGTKAVKTLLTKAEEEVEHLKKMIDKQVDKAIDKIKPSYDNEFKKINQKLDKLAKELDKISNK